MQASSRKHHRWTDRGDVITVLTDFKKRSVASGRQSGVPRLKRFAVSTILAIKIFT